jgi:hypothetical protein
MLWSENIVKLDLRICKTLDDCRRLREDNDIPEELISDEKLFSYKDVVDVFFYDRITFNIMAIIPNGTDKIQFTEDFINHMVDLNPLKFKKRNLDLDEILDKISSMGLESLNKLEKRFLRKF